METYKFWIITKHQTKRLNIDLHLLVIVVLHQCVPQQTLRVDKGQWMFSTHNTHSTHREAV